MDIQVAAQGGTLILLNVRPNVVSMTVNEETVYTFDREGRLVTAVIDDRTYRRGLDNRMLCKWREEIAGSLTRHRRWLTSTSAQGILEHVSRDVKGALSALEKQAVETGGVSAGDPDSAEAIRWLRRLAAMDFEALQGDAGRMAKLYRPVSILPPDQYLSLVLQATEGCTYNRCSFCSFYRDRPFHIKSPEEFREHISAVVGFLGEGLHLRRSVFLADANALCIEREQLLPLLDMIDSMLFADSKGAERRGTRLEGIYSFVDAFSEPERSAQDYAELKGRGVERLYLGVETGSGELLRFLRKPQKPEDVRSTFCAIKGGGLNAGVILMLGIGGDKFAGRHVDKSLALLNSLPWSEGDLVFLSDFVEFPNLEYPEIAAKAGIRPLSQQEMQDQYSALRNGIHRFGRAPKIAPYNAEEFIY